jgi:Tol biopolymer transport system component
MENTVWLWEADGTPGSVLKGHTGAVQGVAWSADGQWLASASSDKTVRLWQSDGIPGLALDGHEGPVRCLAWSPDGRQVAAGTTDCTVQLWHTDGNPGPVLKEPDFRAGKHVKYVAWSPDGRWIASLATHTQNAVQLWHPDGTVGPALKGHDGHVESAAWSPNGRYLATSGDDHTIRLWESDGTPGLVLNGYSGIAGNVRWSPDGKQIAAVVGAARDTIMMWDIETGEPLSTAFLLPGDENAVTFSPSGQILHGDPEVVEEELVYVVQCTKDGPLEWLTPSEFQKRAEAAEKVEAEPQALPGINP